MAESPAHRFGQIIGNLLEEIVDPMLTSFCRERGLFLDKHGIRGNARPGKKVAWKDKFGNLHDLDFVIEKDGTGDRRGRPVAFVEVAWRRYTKHSRNKAQEIQGAILPIAETYEWDKPFLGVVLAGVFTDGSVEQMKSLGFTVLYFPYAMIVDAFAGIGIDVAFDEQTPDHRFRTCVESIEALPESQRSAVKQRLTQANASNVDEFLNELRLSLDRMVEMVAVIPLYGQESSFATVADAADFLGSYSVYEGCGEFRKYEIHVRFTNGDSISASLKNAEEALRFLRYAGGDPRTRYA